MSPQEEAVLLAELKERHDRIKQLTGRLHELDQQAELAQRLGLVKWAQRSVNTRAGLLMKKVQ